MYYLLMAALVGLMIADEFAPEWHNYCSHMKRKVLALGVILTLLWPATFLMMIACSMSRTAEVAIVNFLNYGKFSTKPTRSLMRFNVLRFSVCRHR